MSNEIDPAAEEAAAAEPAQQANAGIVGAVGGLMSMIGQAQNVPSESMIAAGTIALTKFNLTFSGDGRDVVRAVYEAMEQRRVDDGA